MCLGASAVGTPASAKELATENGGPRRAICDLTLDKLILTEAAKANF